MASDRIPNLGTKKFVPTTEQVKKIAEMRMRQNGESIRKVDGLSAAELTARMVEALQSVGYTIEDLESRKVDVQTVLKALSVKREEAAKAAAAKAKAAEENGGESFGV